MENQKIKPGYTLLLWGVCLIALMVWLAGSWLAADSLQTSRANALISEQTGTISQQAENIKVNISHNLETLHGIPSVVARDGDVLRALSHFSANTYPATLAPAERKSLWSKNVQLKTVSSYLNLVSQSLGSDVIYVMNAAGDCIASSNADKSDSFVGANYATREYFKTAIKGNNGNQYAVGKTSNISGLYFSAPVSSEGRIIGVVSVKINMSALAHWVNQTDAFISDQYGVIILSSDARLDMRALPDAAISALSTEARMARYRRDNFPPLTVSVWPGSASLQRFDQENQPVLLTDRTLAKDNINIYVFKRLPEIVEFTQDRLRLFLLLSISGALAILFIGARINYNRTRKQTERALRDSEASLREAQMIGGLGSYVVDLRTGRWGGSDMLFRLFGIGEVYERTQAGWDALIHPVDRAMLDEYFKNDVLAQGKVFDKEYRIIRHDDQSERWIHQLGKLSFDAQGHPLKMHGTLEDTTRQIQIQDELRSARDAAEAANRTKSVFLANMSHELRTPLNAIIGYSEMLEEDAESEGRMDFVQDLQKIKSAGRNLLELINDVLDLSKIEAGKIELYAENIDLTAMTQQLASTIQPLVTRNGNTLQMHLPDDLGCAFTDQTKLRQVLLNLLSNACKFTERGVVTMTAARETVTGVDWLIFAVTDSGIGMTTEQMGRLFQAFSQADTSTTRKYGGTGLGLMISRHFCQMLGGDITVTSLPGQGSAFTVRLPATLQQDASVETIHRATAQHETTIVARATVLVIDDDPNARDLLRRLLGKEGFRVECAAGGNEGLKMAQTLLPDIITLDAMMPDKDGWTVLSELKANPLTAQIPVIMLTMMDNQNLGFSLGAADYLNKPVSRERLLETVGKHLSNRDGTILIVEDDIASRQMLRRALEQERWPVIEAENGRVALERIAEHIPALILLDLMMPEMDGFQVIEQLHQHDAWRTIPVVIITAKDLTRQDMERLNGSVLQIVQKGTYSQSDLLAQVRRLVNVKKS
ncbi:MAG: response regulator [Gallionella sp.]|nr:response regulator [Gallionella sp.]